MSEPPVWRVVGDAHALRLGLSHGAVVAYHGGFVERPDTWLLFLYRGLGSAKEASEHGSLAEAQAFAEAELGVNPKGADDGRQAGGI